MMRTFSNPYRLVALPLVALAVSACASTTTDTTGEAPPILPPPDLLPEPDPTAPVAPEEVTYVTEVERIPQLDGSLLVVTTVKGSDGSIFVEEEIQKRTTARLPTQPPTRGPASIPDGDDEMAPLTPDTGEVVTGGSYGGDMDDFADLGEIEEMVISGSAGCDPDNIEYEFDWPPPEPSAKVEIPRFLVEGRVPVDELTVERIQTRVEGALRRAGYTERAYYQIDCDGFAVITRMEQIDRRGEPVEDGLRFTVPGEDEGWSLSSYLTRLFYAPPGYYRQIILAGTDEPYDEENLAPAPDEAALQSTFDAGADEALEFDPDEMWGDGHTLYALIYEFETEGARSVKQTRPSDVSGADHVKRSGIYRNLD